MNKIMKTSIKSFISIILLLVSLELTGQDIINFESVFSSGISIDYGIGNYSVKDEYISEEKYSGTLPYYNVEWVRFRNNNGYRLQFEYRKSTNIKNNNISAEVQQFAFNQDFIYPIGSFLLFSKNIYAFIGPSLQYYYYDINYNFVRPGTFIFPKSFGNQGSLGINATLIVQLNKKLFFESFIRSNLLSITGKLIDEDAHSKSSPRLLTIFSATKFDFDLSMRYYLIKKISFSFGYKFDLSRINKWEPYIAASDNLIISVHYKF